MEAIKLEDLSHIVLCHLPQELQPHCQVSSFRNGKLILATAQSTWATQLRYFIPELRDILRTKAKLHQLISIEVKIVN